MITFVKLVSAVFVSFLAICAPASAGGPNKVAGAWRMVSAQIDPNGENRPAYGVRPNGWLVFTDNMKFIEVLTSTEVPRFQSNVRGQGTDEENRAAMAGGIGFFGSYTLDEAGEFSGNQVEGSTFPNWVGDMRTREQLTLTVDGDFMTEDFRRPDGTEIKIVWERLR